MGRLVWLYLLLLKYSRINKLLFQRHSCAAPPMQRLQDGGIRQEEIEVGHNDSYFEYKCSERSIPNGDKIQTAELYSINFSLCNAYRIFLKFVVFLYSIESCSSASVIFSRTYNKHKILSLLDIFVSRILKQVPVSQIIELSLIIIELIMVSVSSKDNEETCLNNSAITHFVLPNKTVASILLGSI